MQFKICSYETISSTNDEIKRGISAGADEGLVICAKEQKAGRGRQGRTWISPRGGLYMSILLRPTRRNFASLSLVSAIAVKDALDEYSKNIMLKWPNDVVIANTVNQDGKICDDKSCSSSIDGGIDDMLDDENGKFDNGNNQGLPYSKICGILAESRQDAICLGIGVNVIEPCHEKNQAEEFDTKKIDINREINITTPAYLKNLTPNCPSLDELRDNILGRLKGAYKLWQKQGFSPFANEFNRFNILNGKSIVALNIDGKVSASGLAQKVDIEGNLLIELEDKTTVALRSGEVHLAARP